MHPIDPCIGKLIGRRGSENEIGDVWVLSGEAKNLS